jgi:hypothetical protein
MRNAVVRQPPANRAESQHAPRSASSRRGHHGDGQGPQAPSSTLASGLRRPKSGGLRLRTARRHPGLEGDIATQEGLERARRERRTVVHDDKIGAASWRLDPLVDVALNSQIPVARNAEEARAGTVEKAEKRKATRFRSAHGLTSPRLVRRTLRVSRERRGDLGPRAARLLHALVRRAFERIVAIVGAGGLRVGRPSRESRALLVTTKDDASISRNPPVTTTRRTRRRR